MASDEVNLERALLAAIDDDDLPTADSLIRSGADVNRRGPLPLTALMLAAGRGSTQMVGKLLAAGADVHVVDSTMGASALHFAAQSGVVDIAQLLLDAGAFINLQSATVGLTPLITAIWAKQTPLLVACFLRLGAIARALIAAGADPRINDYLLGATPAHKAAYAGRPDALAALREHGGVEINAQGPFNGYTALHDAVWHGHREALAILLDWPGVRFDLRGLDGRTPEELARSLGYTELADMIRAKQSPVNGRLAAPA